MNNDIRFYYIRKKGPVGSHPKACVCMLKDKGGIIWRGVSVCSPKDGFTKEMARKVAKRNAEFVRDLYHSDGDTTVIWGRVGSSYLKNIIAKFADGYNSNITRDNGRFYAKGSMVGLPSNGGIPLSPFEARIWADPENL